MGEVECLHVGVLESGIDRQFDPMDGPGHLPDLAALVPVEQYDPGPVAGGVGREVDIYTLRNGDVLTYKYTIEERPEWAVPE